MCLPKSLQSYYDQPSPHHRRPRHQRRRQSHQIALTLSLHQHIHRLPLIIKFHKKGKRTATVHRYPPGHRSRWQCRRPQMHDQLFELPVHTGPSETRLQFHRDPDPRAYRQSKPKSRAYPPDMSQHLRCHSRRRIRRRHLASSHLPGLHLNSGSLVHWVQGHLHRPISPSVRRRILSLT